MDEDEIEEIIERIRHQGLVAQLRVRELEIEGLSLLIDAPDANVEDKAVAVARRKNLVEECAQIRRSMMRRNSPKF